MMMMTIIIISIKLYMICIFRYVDNYDYLRYHHIVYALRHKYIVCLLTTIEWLHNNNLTLNDPPRLSGRKRK